MAKYNLGAPNEEEVKKTSHDFLDDVGGFLDKINDLIDKLKEIGIVKEPREEVPPIVTVPEEKPKFWEQPYFPWLVGGGLAAGGIGAILYKMKKRK